jgi:hypothetical protein
MSTPITNPSTTPPSWYDTRFEDDCEPEWRFGAPAPSTLLDCGCHLRRADYEAVLCEEHLAELNHGGPVGTMTHHNLGTAHRTLHESEIPGGVG